MSQSINFFDTFVSPSAAGKVCEVLASTFLSEGSLVKEFELKLQSEFKVRNAAALNSGTSALHLALVLAGVGPGDEVILPAQTFIASGLVVLMQGASPVFCDINYEDGNISPEDIGRRITERTKAIMAVHWAGLPCDMDAIGKIAEKHNLVVIEDAAHALGATYKGAPIGSISDYTCFSFQAIKHLTTGDGGAICVADDGKYREAKRRRWFGLDRDGSKISVLGEREYNVTELGYKYHLNDFCAALGLANLEYYWERQKRRASVVDLYDSNLRSCSGVTLFGRQSYECESAHWLYGMHVERRDDFISHMKHHGIPVSVVHQGIDKNSVFGGLCEHLVNQRRFDQSQIHIPMHSSLSLDQVQYITETIKKGW